MKKKTLITALISVSLLAFVSPTLSSQQPQTVQASASTSGQIKAKRHAHLYRSNGRHSKYYARKNKLYSYTAAKKIRGRWFYKIGNNNHWLLAQDGQLVKKNSPKTYKKASLTLPAGYTRRILLQAAQNSQAASASFKKACQTGMQQNTFSQDNNWSESKKDDRTKVNLNKLTKAQQKEITNFSLRMINDARADLKLPAWRYSKGSQKLAADIAKEYTKHKKSIRTGHYIAGITRACKQNGLRGPLIQDNYVEDMAGFYSKSNRMTMTALKKDVYFGLKQMLFGYAGKNDQAVADLSNYTEWEHAGDLLSTRGSQHDGDFDYYGFSISRAGKVYSLHYIGVPNFVVQSRTYNKNFKI